MSSVRWGQVAEAFAWDGALRDIYVFDTTLDDWRRVIAELRDRYPSTFEVDGEPRDLPPDVAALFAGSRQEAHCWRIHRNDDDRADLNCHFFDTSEIEFDIDPVGVQGQRDLDSLLDVVRLLGNTTSKRTVVTHENGRDAVILEYDPETRTVGARGPAAA